MDGFLSLLALALAFYFLVWKDIVQPLLGLDKRTKPVKSLPPLPAYRKRSRVRNVPNPPNAGSAQQSAAKEPANVPPNVPGSALIAAESHQVQTPAGTLAITPNELQQLAAAVTARATGATVDEAIFKGWGLKKGGGPSYRRARELFDTATKAP